MSGNLFFMSREVATDANGDPISGAKLNFYIQGTNTQKDTYSDFSLSTANANPVVADSAGRFGDIYLAADADYKVILTDASDVTIWTIARVSATLASVAADVLAGTVTTTGLSDSSGVLQVDINGLTAETTVAPASDYLAMYDASAGGLRKVLVQYVQRLPKGYLSGLTMSNGTDTAHDIDVAAGVCRDATDAADISLSAITKQLDGTFAEGTGQGGFVSGESLPTSGTVHAWAIVKANGTADVCFNDHATSGLSPTLPTGFAYKRRIGSLRTDSSANIIGFVQTGDRFMTKAAPSALDWNDTSPPTSGESVAVSVPTGRKLLAIINTTGENTSGTTAAASITDPDTTDVAPSLSSSPLAMLGFQVTNEDFHAQVEVMTDTSAQVRLRATTNTGWTWRGVAVGWIDTRGRDD